MKGPAVWGIEGLGTMEVLGTRSLGNQLAAWERGSAWVA